MKKEKIDYTIELCKYENKRIIKEEDISKDPLSKQFIELIVKDILLTNPNVERFKDTYLTMNKGEEIDVNEYSSFTFYPGYKISFVETDRGNFLNVVLTHKFIRNESILDYLERFGDINDKSVQEDIKAELIGRSFRVCYSKTNYKKRNYRIDDILFDRNPVNQSFKNEQTQETISLIKYYKQAYNKEIKNKEQPLILVRKKGPQGNTKNLFFIPEFCNITGIDEEDVANSYFMKKVSECTKMEPDEKISKINNVIELFQDNTPNEITNEKWSSKKKSDYYGVQVIKAKDLFSAHHTDKTNLIDGKNKMLGNNDRGEVNLLKKYEMRRWLLFYDENNKENADFLLDNLRKASGKYNIKIENPKRRKMTNKAKANEWINEANKYFGKGKREFDFVIFLLKNIHN